MNYTNIALRVSRKSPESTPDAAMILSRESDKRGTHLRLRKVATLLRLGSAMPIGGALLLAFSLSAKAQFVISQVTGIFQPSFRSTTTDDLNNTTYFGWTGNNDTSITSDDTGFDGSDLNLKVNNPVVIRSPGGNNGSINQIGNAETLASSGNVFLNDGSNTGFDAHFTISIPTNGTSGVDGFTTIILQGIGSVTGGGTQNAGVPGNINGVAPSYVVAMNNASPTKRQQWWAKYEIPGNAPSYTVDLFFQGGAGTNPGSLRELSVDTKYSTSSYASDTAAAVPEPTVVSLLGGCGLLLITRRKR